MTTVQLTADTTLAAVTIAITGAPTGDVTVSRADGNGIGTPRRLSGQVPISGSMTLFDYEAALAGDVTYTVTDSAAATVQATTSLGVAFPALHVAQQPSTLQFLNALTEFDESRENAATVHRIIGRADPVVVTTVTRTREGRMVIWTGSYTDARAVIDVAAAGEVLILRQPTFDRMDMYFVALRTSNQPRQEDTAPRRWSVEVQYVEVSSPAGVLLDSAGWGYDDVLAGFASYNDVEAAFADYNALVVGP